MMDLEVSADAPAREVVVLIARHLADAGVPSPDADARWLLEGVTGVDPYRAPGATLDEGRIGALRAAVARRAAREPLQLIIGTTSFRGIELACRPGVFIPRPETEVVAGVAIEAAVAAPTDSPRIVDVCTGTGAIAAAVAVEVAGAAVIATDRDPAAVALARENVRRIRVGAAGIRGLADGSDVEVVQGELLSGIDPDLRGHLDVLVANPPYLPEADRGSWEPEVADHDPTSALVGGVDGHEIVDALLGLAVDWLAPGGAVVIEIDERRGPAAAEVARREGLVDVEVVADLAGVARCVIARRRR
jgi:release factor glutamine methyltransferase